MEAEYQSWIHPLIRTAKEAGSGILNFYRVEPDNLGISKKDDDTLLTDADLSANEIIHNDLQQLTPDIPILSEEGIIPDYKQRSRWPRYWLLDPLDGTRGFTEHRDEFTVNIAFVEHHQVQIGVVYAPVLKRCYYAIRDVGAFKQILDYEPRKIHTKPINWQAFSVLMGHYISSERLPEMFEEIEGCSVLRVNSSLKFCQIAEGHADIYPRFGKTSEWDTAAAQCVLEQAGGKLVDFNGEALQYNAKTSLVNPPFIALGDIKEQQKIIEMVNDKGKEYEKTR